MKDLKHLLYFENLLQEAQNELILQAQNEGKVCAAYVCENTPEPLLNLPGVFFHASARTAHRVHGNGDLLHDKLSLRVQPCSA